MENIRFIKYNKNYFSKCVDLVKQTWDFHSAFVGLKNIDLVYEHYFKSCLNWNAHLEIIVDQRDDVVGLLFGSIENDSYMNTFKHMLQDRKNKKWLNSKIASGNFGVKRVAKEVFEAMDTSDCKGEKYAHLFDSEINLFIVSPEMRGNGLGIKLMDNYIVFCRENNLKRAYLWTNEGCSFSFYENYGFQLHSRFSEFANENHQSGMIFYISIE